MYAPLKKFKKGKGQAMRSAAVLFWPGATEISWTFIIFSSASLRTMEGELTLGCRPHSSGQRVSSLSAPNMLPVPF